MPKITYDCPGFTDCSPQMVYNVVYNFRIIVVYFCFGLCFYVISKPLLLLSVKRTKTLKSMSQPTDQPTERMNERMIFRRSCCRHHHHHSFIFRRWKLIATKMKNIKWLDLWRREVKIGNRVWEFRIMFAFCVCVCVLWHQRKRVPHKYTHPHPHLFMYILDDVCVYAVSDRVLWVF